MQKFSRKTIVAILKQIHPDLQCSASFVDAVSEFMRPTLCTVAERARRRRDFVRAQDILDAVPRVLTGELQTHAASSIQGALDGKPPFIPSGVVAETVALFPLVKWDNDAARLAMGALAEYLLAEIIEVSGKVARDKRRRRLQREHLRVAVDNDLELDELYLASHNLQREHLKVAVDNGLKVDDDPIQN